MAIPHSVIYSYLNIYSGTLQYSIYNSAFAFTNILNENTETNAI